MNFGEALQALKEGNKVARSIWRGYWVMVEKAQITEFRGANLNPLQADYHMRDLVLAILLPNKEVAVATPYWEDMWAEDWQIVE